MPPLDLTDPQALAALIHWGKTLCLPHRSDVEWRVWQLALALELAVAALERTLPPTLHPEHSHD
jgi:hypothetical protein